MTQVGTGCQLDPGRNHPRNFAISRGPIRRDDERKKAGMMRQNASAFCHPEGVFTPLPPAKNVKTTVRIQFIYVSAVPTAFLITWILR